LEASWRVLGPLGGDLEASWGDLGGIWGFLIRSWKPLRGIVEACKLVCENLKKSIKSFDFLMFLNSVRGQNEDKLAYFTHLGGILEVL